MTLLPEYRAQLYGAAQRRARRPLIGRAGWWPVAVSTAVAVGVVVVAVVALSHRHAPGPSAPSSSASPKQQLLDTLGVLRRPQTRADRSTWLPGFLHSPGRASCPPELPCAFTLNRPLVRKVTTPGSPYQVGVLPLTSPTGAADLGLTLNGPGIYQTAGGPWGGGIASWGLTALRTRGLMLSAYVSDGVDRGVLLVPDGVARVVIGPVHLLDTKITSRVAPTPGASAVVHDNVALFRLNGLTVKNLGLNVHGLGAYFHEGSFRGCGPELTVYALPATATMVWFGADGRVLNHVRINLPLYVGTHHPAPPNMSCPASG